jgi:predicted lysophospholipase L1 biosynthesis ABC-type transport system permease subunit
MPSVNPEYFTTLGVRLLEGRMFTPTDTANVPPVVLVSAPGYASTFRMHRRGPEVHPRRLHGVSAEHDHRRRRRRAVLWTEWTGGRDVLAADGRMVARAHHVRSDRRAAAEVTERVRAAIRSVDPTVPLDDAAPMVDRLNASIAEPRHWMTLLGAFAVAALVLAGVGIFGMLSYTVSTRRREIGVRMALGARRQTVVRLVVGRGLLHATIGALLGLGAALVATRSIATVLFGVSPHDPMALAAVTVVLLAVALVACWLPAHRAAAIDPMDAIRLD